MPKNFKKQIRKYRRRQEIRMGKDTHHIFFTRKMYQNGYACKLRQYWYCRVFIPRDTLHKEIHERVGCVPAPRGIAAKNALEHLNLLEKYGAIRSDDNIERRLGVLIALFECCEEETAEALKWQLQIVQRYYKPP